MDLYEEFVLYPEALALKELEFDEPCFAYYTKESTNLDKEGNKTNFVLLSAKLRGELVGHGTVKNNLFKWLKDNDRTSGELYTLSNSVTAPLYQQAFRWFKEKYGLEGVSQRAEDFIWYKWAIYQYNENGKKYIADWFEYKTYEEAELACLQKLIEIVKNK